LNADNGISGEGAVFDHTSLVPSDVLKPDQSTQSKTLRFQIKNMQLPSVGEKNKPSDQRRTREVVYLRLLSMDMRILGEPAEPAPSAK
jgi:hypothetical protein